MVAQRQNRGLNDEHSEDEKVRGGRARRGNDRDAEAQSSRDSGDERADSHSDSDGPEQVRAAEARGDQEEPDRGALAEQLRSGGTVGAGAPSEATAKARPSAVVEPKEEPATATNGATAKPREGREGAQPVADKGAAGPAGPAAGAKTPDGPKSGPKAEEAAGHEEPAAEASDGAPAQAGTQAATAEDAGASASLDAAEGTTVDGEAPGDEGADPSPLAVGAEDATNAGRPTVPDIGDGAMAEAVLPEHVGAEEATPPEVAEVEAAAPGPLASVLKRHVSMSRDAVATLRVGVDTQAKVGEEGLKARGKAAAASVSAGYHHAAKSVRSAGKATAQAIASSVGLAQARAGLAMGLQTAKASAAVSVAKTNAKTTTKLASKACDTATHEATKAASKGGATSAEQVSKFVAVASQGAPGKDGNKEFNERKRMSIAAKSGPKEKGAQGKLVKTLSSKFRGKGKEVRGLVGQHGKAADGGLSALERALHQGIGQVHAGSDKALRKQKKAGIKKAQGIAETSATSIAKTGKGGRRAIRRAQRRLVQGLSSQTAQHNKELNAADEALMKAQAQQLQALLPLFERLLNPGATSPPSAEHEEVHLGGDRAADDTGPKATVTPETLSAQADAIAQSLLQGHIAHLAKMYGTKQATIGALAEEGKQTLATTERRHRAAAKTMREKARGALASLAKELEVHSKAVETQLGKGLSAADKVATTQTQAALKGMKNAQSAAEKGLGDGLGAALVGLDAKLAKRTGRFRELVAQRANAETKRAVNKVVAKRGALSAALETGKEAAAAAAVRGIGKDEAMLLRYMYRTHRGASLPGAVRSKLDEGSERSETLAWVRGRRASATQIVMARAADDSDAMADLETAMRSLDKGERKELTDGVYYDGLRLALKDEVSATDAAVVDALASGDDMSADVLRFREALIQEDQVEKAAGLVAKHASDPKTRAEFAAKFAAESQGIEMAAAIDAVYGQDRARANLLHNSAANDKVGAKAARVSIAFDEGNAREQSDAMMNRDLYRARNNPELHSEDPQKRAAAEKTLAKAKAEHAALNDRYKQDYGMGAVDMKAMANHKAADEDDSNKRLLIDTAHKGDASLATKLLAGTDGVGTDEDYITKHQKAATKQEALAMHRELAARGLSYNTLMAEELDTAGQHQMRLNANGIPETWRDHVERAKISYGFSDGAQRMDGLPDWLQTASSRAAKAKALGVGGAMSNGGRMEATMADLQLTIQAAQADGKVTDDEAEKIKLLSKVLEQDAGVVHEVRMELSNDIDNCIAIASAVAITVASAGSAGPVAIALATAASEGARIAMRAAIQGQAYGDDELAKDIVRAAATAVTAGLLTPKSEVVEEASKKLAGSALYRDSAAQAFRESLVKEAVVWASDDRKWDNPEAGLLDSIAGIFVSTLTGPVKTGLDKGLEKAMPKKKLAAAAISAITMEVLGAAVTSALGEWSQSLSKKDPERLPAKESDEKDKPVAAGGIASGQVAP